MPWVGNARARVVGRVFVLAMVLEMGRTTWIQTLGFNHHTRIIHIHHPPPISSPTTKHTQNTRHTKHTTLVVDVFDKAQKKLVWEGVGTKTVDDNPNTREKNSAKVAAAIMKPFPIEPIKE